MLQLLSQVNFLKYRFTTACHRYFGIFVPPLTRDALIRAYGVDCLFEEGKILLIGNSIDDWPGDSKVASDPIVSIKDKTSECNDHDEVIGTKKAAAVGKVTTEDLKDMPWRRPKGWFTDRMIVKDFKRYRSITITFNTRVTTVLHV